ncbi:MAG: TIGR04283 family arsenosugar biosynthesis glycosyltransferase [Bacteroidetes bacterium]|nr:TIGR04283 family arsenosugar biosynthesis glycosyltransferase [Bacteroidota bacterium]
MSKYSVIIPTLNEEKYLPHVLEQLKNVDEDLEIIIADGGSKDNTVKIAEKFNVEVCKSEKGKGIQLNNGAGCATGDVLIFLHADTFLPVNAFSLINEYLLVRKVDIATFKMKFDKESFLMDIYSWFTKFDSIFTSFGDQVIVIRRDFFNKLNGFPNLALFEDVELCRKARSKTKIYKLPAFVTTSARRFETGGTLKTQLLNGLYFFQYLIGIDPDNIYKKYFRDKL